MVVYIYSIKGILNNYSLANIFDEVNGYILFIVLFLALKAAIKFEWHNLTRMTNLFIIGSTLISLFTIIMFILISADKKLIVVFDNALHNLNLGSILPFENGFRMFLKAYIYNLFSLIILYGKLNSGEAKNTFILLFLFLLNLAPLLISMTKGLYLSAIIGFVLTPFFIHKKIKTRVFAIGFVVVLIAISTILNISFLQRYKLKDFMYDPERIIQLKSSAEIVKQQHYLGTGYGFIYGLIGERKLDYSIEMTYLDILVKTGIFGFLSQMIFLLLPIKRLLKKENPKIIKIICAAYVAVLIAGASNPYITSSLGILIISFIYWIYENLSNEKVLPSRSQLRS